MSKMLKAIDCGIEVRQALLLSCTRTSKTSQYIICVIFCTDTDSNPLEVLYGMRAYIQKFFGCQECCKNFGRMAKSMDTDIVNDQDGVLWLWRAHNKANKRLHGDATEDPEHPKIQFPSREICETCHKEAEGENIEWNEKAVYGFLKIAYSKTSIIQDHTLLHFSRKDVSSDKGDTKRSEDLKLIQELRNKKRKKKLESMKMQYLQGSEGHSRIEGMRKRELDSRHGSVRRLHGIWGINTVDISLCVLFYIVSTSFILIVYFHFTVRKRMSVLGMCSAK